MVLNNRIGRVMREHRAQYVGIFLLIAVSCFLFTMFNMLSSNMQSMTDAFEQENAQEDASFATSVPLSDVAALEESAGALIEQSGSFDADLGNGKTLRVFSENTKVNVPAILTGSKLSDGDILLDPNYARVNGHALGSEIVVAGKSYRVVGTTSLPNYIYPLKSDDDVIASPEKFGVAVLTKSDFSQLGRGTTSYAIRFNSREDLDGQKTRFLQTLNTQGIILTRWTDVGDNKRVTFVTAKLEGISKVSTAFPLAILLLSCVLSGIVIRRLIQNESPVIGTLYALGYRRKEIIRHYQRFSLWVSLTGSVLGTILGYFSVKPMIDFMVTYFNLPESPIRLNVAIVTLSALMPLVFLLSSGLLILRRTLRFSPVQLMRGATRKTKQNALERSLKLTRLSFAQKFRLREQLRSVSRTTFLLLGVVLATMLLLLGFTAQSSLDALLRNELPSAFHFQYEYVFNSLQTAENPAGTERFSGGHFTVAGEKKNVFEITGLLPDTKFVTLKDSKGNAIDNTQIVLTQPLAERLHVSPGDNIRVVSTLGGKEFTVPIDAIANSYVGEMIFMPLDRFNTLFGLPANSYLGLWSDGKLPIDERQLYRVSTFADSIDAFNTLTEPLQKTFAVISFLSFVIGLIVLYVVTSLIIEENRETISLMKVFGYRTREIHSLVLSSSTFVVILGYAIGIPLILSSLRAMFSSLTHNVGVTLPIRIQPVYLLVGFVIVLLTYELSKLLSRKKVDRIPMSEALKATME